MAASTRHKPFVRSNVVTDARRLMKGGECRVYVTVFFGFDDQGRLIDLWVWKQADSL
jgi:hypothetical protein